MGILYTIIVHRCYVSLRDVFSCITIEGFSRGLVVVSDELSFVWTWYGQDEHAWTLASCEVLVCLEFLTLDAQEQERVISGCPGCETWSGKILPLRDWLEKCPGSQVPEFRDALQRVWGLCNELTDAALGCYHHNIYADDTWIPVRQAALVALEKGGWETLREHVDSVVTGCDRRLAPWRHRQE